MICRNYQPSSESLIEGVVEPAKPSDVESVVQTQLAEANQQAAAMQQVKNFYEL